MDDQVKICPECGAEYYAHIKTCKGCEVDLIYPHEKASYKRSIPKAEGDLVCVYEGPHERMVETAFALKKNGIQCQVLNVSGGGKSCSTSGGYGIFVAQSVARDTVIMIDEINQRLYPELKEAEARLEQGLCPACGAQLTGSPDCPDCGLFLGDGGDNCGGGCGPSCH